MTTKHTPTPYETSKRFIYGNHDDEAGTAQKVAECRTPEDAAFLVHAANHHEDLTDECKRLRDALGVAMWLMRYARIDGLTLEEHAAKYRYGFPACLIEKARALRVIDANGHVLSESALQ